MMDCEADRFDELIGQAESMPHGQIKLKLMEEAVRLADTSRDVNHMFRARTGLVVTATMAGQSEKSFAAFAWCLAHYEREPERFRSYEFDFLWGIKNLIHHAADFPQVSRDQTQQVLEQMTQLYRQAGYGMRPVRYLKFCSAVNIGDFHAAAELLPRWVSEPRDQMADCDACETDSLVEYYGLIGQFEKAVETAGPNLSGQKQCWEVPHRTLAYVLRPLARLGRIDEADQHQARGYRLIRNKPNFLEHVALHIGYLVHRNRLRVARNVVERHLEAALQIRALRPQYLFYVAARRLLARLTETRSSCDFKIASEFPLYDPSHRYQLDDLIRWFDGRIHDIGERFNQRNGNDYFTTGLTAVVDY